MIVRSANDYQLIYHNATSRSENALVAQPELFKQLFGSALGVGRPCRDILLAMLQSPLADVHLTSILKALKSTRLSPFIHELYRTVAQNPAVKPRVRSPSSLMLQRFWSRTTLGTFP